MISDATLVMHNAKKSSAAEMYRKLRTNIIYSKNGKLPQVVVITSATSGEGKTTTSTNLAIAFAQTGRKTILIDCDMRKPAIHQLLGLSKSVGFSSLLAEPEKLNDIIIRIEEMSLDIIVAGPSMYDPTELLSSPNLNKIFETLRGIYDVIIVDTPPVGLTTDSALLVPISDAYMMVVAEGASSVSDFRNAKDHLIRAGADIIGAVFNKMGAVMGKNSYYYKYYYRSSSYTFYEASSENGKKNKKNKANSKNKTTAGKVGISD